MYDVVMSSPTATHGGDSEGVVLDANREVRVKLYMGQVCRKSLHCTSVFLRTMRQVFMGWLWFIPTFHIPHPPNRPYASTSQPRTTTKFILSRKEIDFPLGIGSDIVDVEISLQWCPENTPAIAATAPSSPPQQNGGEGSGVSRGHDDGSGEGSSEVAGLVAGVQAVAMGNVDVGGAVELKQAAED
jgi:phosphatidylinositol-3,4,5-trisphosphate 3-phosphatase and dual-specificity protein phosphatase PTEN